MEHTSIEITLIKKMFVDKRIGGRHAGEQDLCRGIPKHEKGKIPNALKELIKKGFVMVHPTSYGKQYALNPGRIDEIKELFQGL